MKILYLLFLLFAVNSNAADFSPTPMTITVPPQIEYKFDGSPLEIPFTLTGKSGAVWLVINTHGQAENINAVRNGYLGWHYVNKIDTTIYISDRFERQPGENTLIWDGRDENGNKAEPGVYDYYLWGYDDKSDRELACQYIPIGFLIYSQFTKIYEFDEDGLPLSNPLMMGGSFWRFSNLYNAQGINKYKNHGTHFKWELGSDPTDVSLIQTTYCDIYSQPGDFYDGDKFNPDFTYYGAPVFDPKDYNIFYHTSFRYDRAVYRNYFTVMKWNFVSNGIAVRDYNWMGWDKYNWKEESGMWTHSSCYSDDNFIYIPTSCIHSASENYIKLKCITYDGDVVFDKMMNDWFFPNEFRVTHSTNCGFPYLYTRGNNRWYTLGSWCCMHRMIDTSRLLADSDDETDMVVFQNSNGDYFFDYYTDPTLENPWYCLQYSLGENTPEAMHFDSVSIDSNDFNIIYLSNYGIVSFGVTTQDGTGVDYMSFNDDAVTSYTDKGGGQLCDNGSQYDGLYMSRAISNSVSWMNATQTNYVAFDSAHGIITNNPAVESKNPFQFKVAQNTPNPFNPSTTISFTIPEKGNVLVDVYNVAGQKVKTLVNGYLQAGEHSARWDASGFSAGVYFYKVKAGKYEKTMRMTLVR